MKQRLRDASKRQGEVPKKRKSRANAIQDYVSQYDRTHYQLLISFVESPYLPSTAPLSELQKILFKEMRLETHHRGFYVLAKVITRPDRKTAIMALIEDEADEVLLLHLHQQHNEHVRPTEDVIREHSVCIIKEPYFKSIGHGNDVLSVDHVSDLLWLTEDDERIPLQWRPRISQLDKSAVEWKEEGNEAITNGKIQEAIEKQAVLYIPGDLTDYADGLHQIRLRPQTHLHDLTSPDPKAQPSLRILATSPLRRRPGRCQLLSRHGKGVIWCGASVLRPQTIPQVLRHAHASPGKVSCKPGRQE